MSRSPAFTSGKPSSHLAPYTSRTPATPPGLPLPLSRSSSLRSKPNTTSAQSSPPSVAAEVSPSTSEKATFTPDDEAGSDAQAVPPSTTDLPAPTINTPTSITGYSARPSSGSLKPRPLPSPLHPRRRSWFRDDDPSAFGPPSPDPTALSPMATLMSSMSEDEQREELFGESASPLPSARSLPVGSRPGTAGTTTSLSPGIESSNAVASDKYRDAFRRRSRYDEQTIHGTASMETNAVSES